jgi:hypothetical protein
LGLNTTLISIKISRLENNNVKKLFLETNSSIIYGTILGSSLLSQTLHANEKMSSSLKSKTLIDVMGDILLKLATRL